MSQLIEKPELAGELRDHLEKQTHEGYEWVVYDVDNPISSLWDLSCFLDEGEAEDFAREYQQIWNWHLAVPITDLIFGLKEIEYSLKNKEMNRNSLEDFREQAAALKMPAAMQQEIEKQMENNVERIEVTRQMPSRKGHLEATAHVKRGGGDSEYYYFNKYDLALNNKVKPLENGYQYMVRSEIMNGEKTEKPMRRFDSPIQAIAYFKSQKQTSELLTAKVDEKGKMTDGQSLATMKDGKVDYVTKSFQPAYYNPVVENTVYVNKGVGFNMVQSANMLQGGSTYRDDLVSRQGAQYEAWNIYKFDEPRDNYGNLRVKQFSSGYDFKLEDQLKQYNIPDLEDPKKLAQIMAGLKDGERQVVNVGLPDGESQKSMIEAVPRYGNLNFYELEGKPQMREAFLKEGMQKERVFDKKQEQGKQKGQETGLGV
jgi:predicted transcriptional regulator YdeE